ncbi:MAG: DUF3883 domain-containing protein [Armatimonadetes bacterium]|nr:DUF3883 domain-containing protein [Armatimonadota bacterium]
MSDTKRIAQLETAAIVVGYTMSRLDKRYLTHFGYVSWTEAFTKAGVALNVKSSSVSNLRDEFDPYMDNPRQGWHQRPMYANRQRVLDEMASVSDAALFAIVEDILNARLAPVAEALETLAVVTGRTANAAERLLTGRRAERFFLENCTHILGVQRADITDMRDAMCGYDFGLHSDVGQAIEIKGIKAARGKILFTDNEWRTAALRENAYRLIVVANLQTELPIAKVWANPYSTIPATMRIETRIVGTWEAQVDLS